MLFGVYADSGSAVSGMACMKKNKNLRRYNLITQ